MAPEITANNPTKKKATFSLVSTLRTSYRGVYINRGVYIFHSALETSHNRHVLALTLALSWFIKKGPASTCTSVFTGTLSQAN